MPRRFLLFLSLSVSFCFFQGPPLLLLGGKEKKEKAVEEGSKAFQFCPSTPKERIVGVPYKTIEKKVQKLGQVVFSFKKK